jgi:E3 ubiquitin-protein ligase listerin
LYSRSKFIQQAAFDVLHRKIPAAQEQISLDAVLEKKVAQLPNELLSLIVGAPASFEERGVEPKQDVPLQLRGYILSWLLVFDHFPKAASLFPQLLFPMLIYS